MLNFYPVVDKFVWGQINLPILLLVCVAWLALKRGWNALAVAALASLFVTAWDFPRDDMARLSGVLAASNTVKFFAVLILWIFCASSLWESLRAEPASSTDASPAARLAA